MTAKRCLVLLGDLLSRLLGLLDDLLGLLGLLSLLGLLDDLLGLLDDLLGLLGDLLALLGLLGELLLEHLFDLLDGSLHELLWFALANSSLGGDLDLDDLSDLLGLLGDLLDDLSSLLNHLLDGLLGLSELHHSEFQDSDLDDSDFLWGLLDGDSQFLDDPDVLFDDLFSLDLLLNSLLRLLGGLFDSLDD